MGGCNFELRGADFGDWWHKKGIFVTNGVSVEDPEPMQWRRGAWVSNDSGASCLFTRGAKFNEQRVKLYEDFLSDLGISSVVCHCCHAPQGFELRLCWSAIAPGLDNISVNVGFHL